jgi:Zn-dependent peptidase ImmA (M78 family)
MAAQIEKPISEGMKRARKARLEVGLSADQPSEVFAEVAKFGVTAVRRPFAARNVSGMYVFRKDLNRGVAIVNSTDIQSRQRFTLAHELAHHLFDQDSVFVENLVQGERNPVESRANAFAAEYLLPEATVRRWKPSAPWAESPNDVARLALHFGISLEAAAWRLVTANLIVSVDVILSCRETVDADLRSRLLEGNDENLDLPPEFVDLVEDAARQARISEKKRRELLGKDGPSDR